MAAGVPPSDVSPSERVSAALQQLVPAAQKLASASNSLSKPVAQLEASLKRLNLGVACWTTIRKEEDEQGYFTEWAVGYARFRGTWGIVVRQTTGHHPTDRSDEETWAFEDAPRYMKSRAVDGLPELVEGLVAVSAKTAEKLLRKVTVVESIATAASALLDQKKK